MKDETDRSVTSLLRAWSSHRPRVEARLLPLVYEELVRIASLHLTKERGNQKLDPEERVHEAYLRLRRLQRIVWKDRHHFFAMASRTMRRILVEKARGREALKRGSGWARTRIEAVDGDRPEATGTDLEVREALTELAACDPIKASIVRLRVYEGHSMSQVGTILGCSRRTATRHWLDARIWLARRLGDTSDD